MKTKTIAKLALALLVILAAIILFAMMPSITQAEETAPAANNDEINNDVVIDDNWFRENILAWLLGGTVGTGVVGIFVSSLIKRVGENKTLKTLYVTSKDALSKADSELGEVKAQLSKFLNGDLKAEIVEEVKNIVVGSVADTITTRFAKDDSATSRMLSNTELIEAQLSALISAAGMAWKDAEGALAILATSPTGKALRKANDTIEYLKNYVAEKFEVTVEELQAEIDKAIDIEV